MLISEDAVHLQSCDPILSMIAGINGRSAGAKELQKGVYEIGHFGSSCFLRGYEQYPDLGMIGNYGVCDSVENLFEYIPELVDSERKFVVTMTPIRREDEPSDGGWRWHKWGEYIGKQDPQNEYIYDDKHIDLVYCYHIYEKV